MLLDDEMLVSTPDGDKVMKILFTYENEQRHKSYVFLYDEKDEENVLVFSYNEKDNSLAEIEDDEEFKEAEEVLNAFYDDEKIQSIKNNWKFLF